MESPLRPVPDEPVLRLESARRTGAPTLIVADVHLGLGGNRDRPAGPPESSGPLLAERLVSVVRATGASTIVIAGDVKHPIVGTPAPLRPVIFDFFSALLAEGISVELVPGNHDVGLVRWLPAEVIVHSPRGVVRDGVGIFHGHRWPSNAVLRSPRLVTGHLHPGFRLAPTADDPTGKRRCWVRVAIDERPKPSRRRRRHAPLGAREIVVLPAFNPIAGTEALNRARPARGRSFLWHRFLARGTPRAYLLDGTDLGPLATGPVRPGTSGGPSRSRPDR